MGCGGSKPEPEPEQPAEPTEKEKEMAAIRAKLAEAKDKGGFKKDKTFRRKFEGFKAGGGSKHTIHRADGSEKDKEEAEAINAKIAKKNAPPAKSHSMGEMAFGPGVCIEERL